VIDHSEIESLSQLLVEEPEIKDTLLRTGHQLQPNRKPEQFVTLAELALLPVFYPVLVYLTRNMLFPWLVEGVRYSELWRVKFRNWVDEQHEIHGVSANDVKLAGQALSSELEKIDSQEVQKAWERFAELFPSTTKKE